MLPLHSVVATSEVVVDRDEVDALAAQPVRYAGNVETRVLPSPFFISATQPKATPQRPSADVEVRWPMTRQAASRTTAKASMARSSRSAPLASVAELARLGQQLAVGQLLDARSSA